MSDAASWRHPVSMITRADTAQFIDWLARQNGGCKRMNFSLPAGADYERDTFFAGNAGLRTIATGVARGLRPRPTDAASTCASGCRATRCRARAWRSTDA